MCPSSSFFSVQEDMESTHSCCLAVRCISELLLQTTLYPVPGNPTVSSYLHRPRHRDLPFLGSRWDWEAVAFDFCLRSRVRGHFVSLTSRRREIVTYWRYHIYPRDALLLREKFCVTWFSTAMFWSRTMENSEIPIVFNKATCRVGNVQTVYLTCYFDGVKNTKLLPSVRWLFSFILLHSK